jgi:hypothetical protein
MAASETKAGKTGVSISGKQMARSGIRQRGGVGAQWRRLNLGVIEQTLSAKSAGMRGESAKANINNENINININNNENNSMK